MEVLTTAVIISCVVALLLDISILSVALKDRRRFGLIGWIGIKDAFVLAFLLLKVM